MDNSFLYAISPVDGRYKNKTKELELYFSEFALMKYRVFVEVEYFISLIEIIKGDKFLNTNQIQTLRKLYIDFSEKDALRIKEIENRTNHDVKSIEYFLREKFDELGFTEYKEFIHFGLTSQDINNTAIPLSIKEALEKIYFTELENIINKLKELADIWKDIPMLAHTHGQPASPTKVGKEIRVFIERIENQYSLLKNIPITAKFGGATGNFNAHVVAYPNIDWIGFANDFINKLGLKRLQTTTQIDHYDNLGTLFDNLKRINTIFIDLNQDMWLYISMEYFKQKIKPDEVGSSTMPHKVNPIDFENSEGNLQIANAIFEFLSRKLPISRLQRDLTDSTVIRNIGVPIAHTLIAFKSLIKGLNKIEVNKEKLNDDLEKNWIVVAEGIQTILRREGYPDAYDILKKLSRGNKNINKETLNTFIDSLNIDEKLKNDLKAITPFNYTGLA